MVHVTRCCGEAAAPPSGISSQWATARLADVCSRSHRCKASGALLSAPNARSSERVSDFAQMARTRLDSRKGSVPASVNGRGSAAVAHGSRSHHVAADRTTAPVGDGLISASVAPAARGAAGCIDSNNNSTPKDRPIVRLRATTSAGPVRNCRAQAGTPASVTLTTGAPSAIPAGRRASLPSARAPTLAGHWSEVRFGGCAGCQDGDRPKGFGGRPCQRHETVAHEGGGRRHVRSRRDARLARTRRARIPRETWCGPRRAGCRASGSARTRQRPRLAGAEDVRRNAIALAVPRLALSTAVTPTIPMRAIAA